MTNRPALPCLALLALAVSGLNAQAPDHSQLQRILVAEDARGKGTEGLTPLLEGLASRDTVIRRVAIRGIGRLQQTVQAGRLLPLLRDSIGSIRSEAAIALAQSLRNEPRGMGPRETPDQPVNHLVLPGLGEALGSETNDSVAGVMSVALGRLPHDSVMGKIAEEYILRRAGGQLNYGMAHGLYWLELTRRFSGGLSPTALALLQKTALSSRDSLTRRMAILTLVRTTALDSATLVAASRDPDAQVRRLALGGAGRLSATARAGLVSRAFRDSSVMVRVGAVAASRAGPNPPDCAPLITALEDPHPFVILAALDAMGLPCANQEEVARVLARVVGFGAESDTMPRAWQANAHALVALAKIDSVAARPLVEQFATSQRWQNRLYAATAAGHIKHTRVLYHLAGDNDNNVREAAITGLAAVQQHVADTVYLRALSAEGNQVLLAASEALEGTAHPRALPVILDAFDRISWRRSENARDPRLSLLKRIGELGTPATAPRLHPYLSDFDTTIAKNTALTLIRWGDRLVEFRPAPLAIRKEPLADVFLVENMRLRVTMARSSGGGSFVIQLFPRETPATVARVVRLAREGYYNGHLFQRVEPNFVIQGGGPDASEYVGDDAFMRDEIAFHSHFRGTLGISTRGRDTGDAQVFINLVDNPRLDQDYTVFGQVVEGMDVVDQILEGDVIGTIEVVAAR